jgi:hypothetical protein
MAESTTYRSVADADAYFANQLWATDWTGASDADKAKALLMATRAVDSLRYDGVKRSVWEALVADGNVDTTLTIDQNITNSELTELEVRTAEYAQIKQFPRNDADESEAWLVTITGSPSGGNWTLTLNGETTGNIAFNAAASTVQAALEALTSVTAGDVTVSGDEPYTITMGGSYSSTWFNTLTADGSSLTGGSTPDVTVETVEDNVPDDIFYAVCEEAKNLLAGRDA